MKQFPMKALCALAMTLALSTSALAQAWPSKPIRVIVPYPAGGAVDVTTRLVTQQMQRSLGQPVVVDNRPGANANIGAELAVRSPADGYTVLVTAAYVAANGLMESNLRWSPKDLEPVARFATAPNVMVVAEGSPLTSVQALVKAAKARPGALNFGEAGASAPQTMSIEALMKSAAIDMRSVRYAGAPQIILDLGNGTLDMTVMAVNAGAGMLASGRLKAIANMSARRSALLPDLPSIAEAGYPDAAIESWYGFHVPHGTPPQIVQKLMDAVGEAIGTEEVRTRAIAIGAEPAFQNKPAFENFLKGEEDKWRRFALKKP